MAMEFLPEAVGLVAAATGLSILTVGSMALTNAVCGTAFNRQSDTEIEKQNSNVSNRPVFTYWKAPSGELRDCLETFIFKVFRHYLIVLISLLLPVFFLVVCLPLMGAIKDPSGTSWYNNFPVSDYVSNVYIIWVSGFSFCYVIYVVWHVTKLKKLLVRTLDPDRS